VQEPFLKKEFKPTEGSASQRNLILHPQHIDDLMLWRAFRSGDEKAFITIFNQFTKLMYNYGYKIIGDSELVKDGIQELFMEIWQNRARLGDVDSIKFYLFKSLRRKLVRSKVKSQNRLFGRLSNEYNKEPFPSHEFVLISEQISVEKKETVMIMLNKLTKRQHEAVFLRYFEELNCDQIAAVMGLSKQAVYNLIHHALDELKKATISDHT
jgi:RNA polymerase sigma factor (sigma-70 family)